MMRASFFLLPFLLTTTAYAQTTTQTTVSVSGSAATDESPKAQASASGSGDKDDKEWAERDRKLNEASTLTGGVGLVHTQHAQGGAPGQFRVAFTTEYFSAGFLCSSDFP